MPQEEKEKISYKANPTLSWKGLRYMQADYYLCLTHVENLQ